MLSNSNYYRSRVDSPYRDADQQKPRWLQKEDGGRRVVFVDSMNLYDGVEASDFSLRSQIDSGVRLQDVPTKTDVTADVRDRIVSEFNSVQEQVQEQFKKQSKSE